MAKTGKVKIYGVIGYNWWTDSGVTAENFTRDFDAAIAENDEVAVHINSPGGDVHEGLAIFNTIQNAPKPVHVFIDGIAYSMGGVIAMAGKTVTIAKNGLLMVHSASSVVWGNAKAMREEAETLDRYDFALAESFADRLGISGEEVAAQYFDGVDHFMTAKEAKAAGFVDAIGNFNGEVPAAAQDFKNYNFMKVAASMSHKKGFMEKLREALSFGKNNHNTDEVMKLTTKHSHLRELLAIDGTEQEVEVQVTEEVVTDLEARIADMSSRAQDMGTRVQDLQAENQSITTERDNALARVQELEQELAGAADPTPPIDGEDPDKGGKPPRELNSWEKKAAEAKALREKRAEKK